MRNLKKVLALVVAVAMFASFACVASAGYSDVASTAKYADAVNLLSNLGIITGYEDGTFKPNDTVKRSEAAAMMVRMLGLADDVEQGDTVFTDVDANHWASGYINVAVNSGIINGMGDGTFAPEATLTYGQIVKMIVCALGYEPVAAGNGGWAGGGYLVAGSKAGFTKGINGSMDSAASRATVAMLMYKALEVELMEQDSYSTGIIGDVFRVQKDKTILSEYLELEKVEGIVLETYISDINYQEGDNEIVLAITKNYEEANDEYYYEEVKYPSYEVWEFIADGTSAVDLLGYSVVAYVGENEDGDDEVFAISEKANKNTAINLSTDLIADESFSPEGISYYKSESSRNATEAEIQDFVGKSFESAFVTNVPNIVVNGFNVGYMDFEIVYGLANEGELEEITLLDNDNDGEFEFIFATMPTADAVEFVVEETDAEDYTITGIDNMGSLELPYEDTDTIITIIKDGKVVDFDAIVEGDVVTCLDADINVLTVYVSSVVVEGTVDEIDGEVGKEVYTIEGNEYKVSPVSEDEIDLIEAGDNGIYYLNAMGKIAYVDTVSTAANADTVIVIDADYSEGDFGKGKFIVKVVNAAGEIEVFALKSKKIDVFYGETVINDEGDEVLEYLRDKDLEDDVVFNRIFGTYDEDEGEVYDLTCHDASNPLVLKIDTTAAGEIDTIYLPNGDRDFAIDTRYAADGIEEKKSYNEVRGTYGHIDLEGGVTVFNIDSNEWDKEEYEDAVTVSTVANTFVDDNSYSFWAFGRANEVPECLVTLDAKAALDAEAPVMVVTRVAKVVADDEETIKITGVRDGETVTVIVDPEENLTVDDVEKYNVVLYSMTAGYATDVAVLMANDEDGLADEIVLAEDMTFDISDEMVSIHAGLVEDTETKSFTIADGEFYYGDNVNFITVDYRYPTPTVKVGKKSDVKASEVNPVVVFIKTAAEMEDEVTDVVCFKFSAE